RLLPRGSQAPVVQQRGYRPAKPAMSVRFLPGAFRRRRAAVAEQQTRRPQKPEPHGIEGANPSGGNSLTALLWANKQSRLFEVQEFPGANPGRSIPIPGQ